MSEQLLELDEEVADSLNSKSPDRNDGSANENPVVGVWGASSDNFFFFCATSDNLISCLLPEYTVTGRGDSWSTLKLSRSNAQA